MMSQEQAARRPERGQTATRGHLRIYLGSAPGTGKTCAMLREGHRRAERGTDVVVAGVKTHGRPHTAALLEGLEVISRAKVPFRGAMGEDFDLDAALARRPEVALLDELAHANRPGSRHATRWQDAEHLLKAGIDVICTLNIQQLDSLRDVAEKLTGDPPGPTVPDAFARAADEVEIVDLVPEVLRDRMAHGDIYPAGQAQTALANWFRVGNLCALREIALRWLAAKLAEDRQQNQPGGPLPGPPQTRERVVVALPGGPEDEKLIRRAARITTRSAGDLLAIHITRPGTPASTTHAPTLAAQRHLVSSAGGTYHHLTDHDIPTALLTFAQAENATQLVLGTTRRSRRPARLPRTTTQTRILRSSAGIDVHIIPCTQVATGLQPTAPAGEPGEGRSDHRTRPARLRRRPSGERADAIQDQRQPSPA
jgi:two-component system sensor histidine kinase KdpD